MRWYRQDSNIFDRPWAKDPKAVALYIYLHCAAYVQPGMYHGQMVRRGSVPTSRSAIMEATGLSEYDVKSRLKLLVRSNEIILKISNVGTIITVCDYDGYVSQEDLFEQDLSNELPSQLPSQLPNESPTTPINNKKIINNIYLRSNNIPSKKERENSEALVREIKALYNRTFSGKLVEWKRLSEKMILKVETCIQRFGRQSADMVFDQILHEPFSLGENNTGFRADFDFIFRTDQYEKYLERYKLRIQKRAAQSTEESLRPDPEASAPGTSPYRQEETLTSITEKRKSFLIGWVNAEAKHPTLRGHELLLSCYKSGELQQLGIQWQPSDYIQQ